MILVISKAPRLFSHCYWTFVWSKASALSQSTILFLSKCHPLVKMFQFRSLSCTFPRITYTEAKLAIESRTVWKKVILSSDSFLQVLVKGKQQRTFSIPLLKFQCKHLTLYLKEVRFSHGWTPHWTVSCRALLPAQTHHERFCQFSSSLCFQAMVLLL